LAAYFCVDPLDLAMLDLHKVEPRIFKLIDGGDVDPWDIDIVQLCDLYLGEIRSRQDLRISGNALLTAAILLRFKSRIFDEPSEEVPSRAELAVPEIEIIPVARKIERKVTVFELLDALNEAFDLEKQRVAGNNAQPDIRFYAFDMSGAIEKFLAGLPDDVTIEALGAVTLLALLHLAMKGVIRIEQEEWNGAIRVNKVGGSGPVHGGQAG
jgi:chromatin segregation and condensation protein Rec8/ScpA/Scc1 (kleisin family)